MGQTGADGGGEVRSSRSGVSQSAVVAQAAGGRSQLE